MGRVSVKVVGQAGAICVALAMTFAGSAVAAPLNAKDATEIAAHQWRVAAARQLLMSIDASAGEGLDPRDYGGARLRQAIDGGEGDILDVAANQSALALAHDYAAGRVTDYEGMDWHIASDQRFATIGPDLQAAVARDEVGTFLESLLPANPRYRALRAALAGARDPATRDRLRVNMERWRWMPRELGDDYLYVNVPSYQLAVVRDGLAQSRYTVVVGAKDTPTPNLMGPASSLVVNPWWNVPPSIVKSANLRPGRADYRFTAIKGGWQVRQPPGPNNALGRLKINLVNDQAIYLHDTPAKGSFAKRARALSHGCIRVKDIDLLAGELIGDAAADGRLDTALAGDQTTTLRLSRDWQVYLVYFTVDLGDDDALVSYGDPYGRDAALIARLDTKRGEGTQLAVR